MEKMHRCLITTRPISVRIFSDNGFTYFRTREVASLIGVKQPFEFVLQCKKAFGENVIVKGQKTRSFRDPTEDSDRTTFIDADTLYRFLQSGDSKSRKIDPVLRSLMQELPYYCKYC